MFAHTTHTLDNLPTGRVRFPWKSTRPVDRSLNGYATIGHTTPCPHTCQKRLCSSPRALTCACTVCATESTKPLQSSSATEKQRATAKAKQRASAKQQRAASKQRTTVKQQRAASKQHASAKQQRAGSKQRRATSKQQCATKKQRAAANSVLLQKSTLLQHSARLLLHLRHEAALAAELPTVRMRAATAAWRACVPARLPRECAATTARRARVPARLT
eukprot:351873-Chlamydomonas_euryale.AAC.3